VEVQFVIGREIETANFAEWVVSVFMAPEVSDKVYGGGVLLGTH
jgi:hypothetical protein